MIDVDPLVWVRNAAPLLWIDAVGQPIKMGQAALVANNVLHDIPDYREAIQRWFSAVRLDGHLVIIVPHAFLAERRLALPVWGRPQQQRLYTPRSLMAEVEESLLPNSYRIRWLGNRDAGYDYMRGEASQTDPQQHIVLVLQRIDGLPLPAQALPAAASAIPGFASPHLRVEASDNRLPTRIIVLKLDHLGDFVLATGAMRRLRERFPAAHITVVIGSWNEPFAQDLGLFDDIIQFDAFPRDASERSSDLAGAGALLAARLTEHYDLAIDLRVETDARSLVERIHASIRAGIGLKTQFPYLDIALPLDRSPSADERAFYLELPPVRFQADESCQRNPFAIAGHAIAARRIASALLWGPYEALDPGDYTFEPYIYLGPALRGELQCDVALNGERHAHRTLTSPEQAREHFAFTSDTTGSLFEFRIWPGRGRHVPDFSFFGGRLTRVSHGEPLHQSECLILLIELVAARLSGSSG